MKNVFKHLFGLLLITGLSSPAIGKTIDVGTAKTVGANFLISEGVQGVTGTTDLTLAYTATTVSGTTTLASYYVFNVTGAKGFVMIAADNIIIPVLAYSGEASFDITKISPSAKDWINGYKSQVLNAINISLPAKTGTAERWTELENGTVNKVSKITGGVSAMIHTTWDQYEGGTTPYNYLCPNTLASGGLSVTGCVSTAMAQLMKYWNWPTVGCGSHTYTDPSSGATLTADFGNTAYDWADMPLSSSNLAVATLMYHTGVSVNMEYTASESGSWVLSMENYGSPNCAAYALQTYFHYKPTLKSVPRYGEYYSDGYYEYYGGIYPGSLDSISESTWVSMLQTELSAGRPMLYTGAGSDGGHCWICDGWETSGDMFHFNWGWSGSGPNGFYTVDDLSPPILGAGGGSGDFNADQGVIMNVEPDSFPADAGNIKLLAHLNTTVSSPMPYGAPFSMTTTVVNSGAAAFTGAFRAVVYDNNDNIVDTVATLNGESILSGDSASLTFDKATGMYAVIPVSYHSIRVLFCPSGSTTWTPVANNGSFYNYTILDVLNDTDVTLFDSLHIGSYLITPGSPVTVSTTIGNQAAVDFNGSLQAILINVVTDSSYLVQQQAGDNIAANYGYNSYTFTNSAMTVPAGWYALQVQHQYNGAGAFYTTSSDFYPNPVLLRAAYPTAVPTLSYTANDIVVYPNPAGDVVNIAIDGTGITSIYMMDIQGRTLKTVDATNQSVITLPVNNFADGVYFVKAQTNEGAIITKKIVIAK